MPINLPTNGNINFKAADSTDVPRNMIFAGPISGGGGFTKIGPGRLTLAANNTFTGGVRINAGVLEVDGTVGPGSDFEVNSEATLTGDGSINRAVVLNAGGTLRPGSATTTSALTASSVTWNGNSAMSFELGTSSNQLAVTGALTKGSAGQFNFAFTGTAGLAAGNTYTLSTFGSTNFTAADFTYSGLPAGLAGSFTVSGNSILFEVFAPPVIVTQPQDAVVLMGGTATFTVVVNPTPTLTYQWLKDAQPISGATSAILTITGVQAADIASYSVVVANAAGSVTSDAATLSIAPVALIRHAPAFGSADVHGSLQQMFGESVSVNGTTSISGDLLVPGTPNVVLNGSPVYGGTVDGTGNPAPANYTVILNSNTSLGHVVRRTDPIDLPIVNAPLPPTGTRSVILQNPNQSVGDWTTVRNLTLNSNVGQVVVPAGAYGNFIANGASGFTLGVTGASEPPIYYFESLTLNNGAQLQVLGRVIVVIGSGFSINRGVVGNSANPAWLTLNIYNGGLSLNQNSRLYGYVTAPAGTVTINGGCQIFGGLASDRLTINSRGSLSLNGPPN